jgi:hypothetical protein
MSGQHVWPEDRLGLRTQGGVLVSSDRSADNMARTQVVAVCLRADVLPQAIAQMAPAVPIVLFAPDDQLDRFSRGIAPGASSIRHVPALPGPRSQRDTGLIYNLPGLASFAEPALDLYAIWPGLKITSRVPVARLGPSDLAAALDPDASEILLFVDAPGAEADILDAFDAAGALQQVSQVVVRCGQERFFTAGSARTDISARLGTLWLTETAAEDADPDWPIVTYRIDHRLRQIAALTARIADLETALQATETAQQAAQAQLSQQTAARLQAEQTVSTLQAEADQLRATAAQHQTVAADALRKQETALTELGFSVRLQAMLQQDLRATRDRLATSETERLRQEVLLRKLTPKLAEAAGYLRQLQQDPVAPAARVAPPKPGGKKGTGRGEAKPDRKAKPKAR